MDEGTSSKTLPDRVVVGRVLAPRGLHGEVRVEVISDSPERFSAGGILYADGRAHRIQRSSELPRGTLALKLAGINTRDDAETLRDSYLMVPEELVPTLPEGKYYHYQIIDMRVYTEEQEYLGQITDILSTGSNDVYVVSDEGQTILVPALEDVIKEVDIEQGTMTVDLPEGIKSGT